MREQLITVIIADRPYRLKVKSHEEEFFFREAGKLVKEKMSEYGNAYAFRDNQDLLAMVSLYLATENLNINDKKVKLMSLQKELVELEGILDDCLEKS